MNGLTIGVLIFLLAMTWLGGKKGFVRMLLSFTAVLLTLLIVNLIHDPLEQIIKEQTNIYQRIESGVGNYVSQGVTAAASNTAQNAERLIDSLNLPEVLKSNLRSGNTTDNYRELGVSGAADYVTVWLSSLVFSAFVYALAFLIVRIGIWIISALLNSLMKLPVLHQLNKLLGAAVGLCLAIIIIWIGALIVTACAAAPWGQTALRMIEESPILSFIYNHNFLMSGIIAG